MNNSEKEQQDKNRVVELLEELVKWIRATSKPNVKKLLEDNLLTPEEKVAYESSDGKSSQEVAKLCNKSFSTVTVWWKNWINLSMAESVSAKGGQRAKRVFSLSEFGIEIPKLVPKEKAKAGKETTQPQPEEKQEGTQ